MLLNYYNNIQSYVNITKLCKKLITFNIILFQNPLEYINDE